MILLSFLKFFLKRKKKQYTQAVEKKSETDSTLNGSIITMIIMEIIIIMKYERKGLLHSVSSHS